MHVFAEGRIEHKKLNQLAALSPAGWVFGVQLDSIEKSNPLSAENRVEDNVEVMVELMSDCVCRTRTQVTAFGVQLDSPEIVVSANAEKRADFIPTFFAT